MGVSMISVEKLSKYYGGFRAIDNVSFRINEGEIVGLLGLNGAGKSTILKVLGCFLLPSDGKASVSGFSVDENPHEIRKLIGYLPDTPPLYDEMTVRSYLEYVAKLKNVASNKVKERVEAVMDQTNTTGVQEKRLGELSHGYRQRVGIGQALVHDPKVLILDEPINGLDPVQIVEMRDLIISLKGRYTVVLSSHILSEITRTCDRILIVDKGRLVAEGTEAQLQGRMMQTMKLSCDVATLQSSFDSELRKLEGVTGVELQRGVAIGTDRLLIDTDRDVRAAVAAKIVNSGIGLLGMTRADTGLEGVFMKLIKTGEERSHV
jgi:ABC-2 type transport system ATP-binding protein